MTQKIISQIKFEIDQIDRLLAAYGELLTKSQKEEPDLVEVTALASVLHSFYNGLENIFLSIAKGIDVKVPAGSQWHRDLLAQMAEVTLHRNAVLTAEMVQRLVPYLGFRHFYRHTYSFFLDWGELEKLVTPLSEVWKAVKAELNQFMNTFSQS